MTINDQCVCVGFTSLLSHSSNTFHQQMTEEETDGKRKTINHTNRTKFVKAFCHWKMIVVKNQCCTERQKERRQWRGVLCEIQTHKQHLTPTFSAFLWHDSQAARIQNKQNFLFPLAPPCVHVQVVHDCSWRGYIRDWGRDTKHSETHT